LFWIQQNEKIECPVEPGSCFFESSTLLLTSRLSYRSPHTGLYLIS
jgi:hypothetical protein